MVLVLAGFLEPPVHALISKGMLMLPDYPSMYRVRQHFDETAISDLPKVIRQELAGLELATQVRAGQSVAVAVGSRGISNLPTLVAATVAYLKELGLQPFILPAMGSHGRADARHQAEVLQHLGITAAALGTPIISHMEVVTLGHLDSGAPVYLAKDAMEADHLVVINRVKPHTAFRAEVESGLCKMLAVGCGKHHGAQCMHTFGLGSSIVPATEMILRRVPVLFGLAIVENPLDQVHTVRAVRPGEFVASDRQLLTLARRMLPRIPLDDLDILVVDEMGKNISGAGIDPNVIGFWRRDGGARQPDYRTLIVLDLTPESGGNALGIGLADLTTRRVIDRMDLEATYTNTLTSGIWASARLPIALENDQKALDAALARVPVPRKVRLARIINTLKLGTFWVSAALLPELQHRQRLTVEAAPLTLQFDRAGRLLPFPGD
jgi:hypothetical protein